MNTQDQNIMLFSECNYHETLTCFAVRSVCGIEGNEKYLFDIVAHDKNAKRKTIILDLEVPEHELPYVVTAMLESIPREHMTMSSPHGKPLFVVYLSRIGQKIGIEYYIAANQIPFVDVDLELTKVAISDPHLRQEAKQRAGNMKGYGPDIWMTPWGQSIVARQSCIHSANILLT